jgi:hypothetical protein
VTEAAFGQDYRRVNAALERYEQREADRGVVKSGSEEESRALDIIQGLRDEERDRDNTRNGIVRFSHIEDGAWVDYVEVRRRGRKQLVRRAP